jgi:von Willebrand factor type D domain
MIFANMRSSFLMTMALVAIATPSVEATCTYGQVKCYPQANCYGTPTCQASKWACAKSGGLSYKKYVNGAWVCMGTCHSGGDPHFNTWSGDTYSYHGECDLVLLSNPEFRNGLGLNVHVRTEIESWYSFISNVAVQVGEDIVEVTADKVIINGVENPKLPASLTAGIKVSTRKSKTNEGMIFYGINLGEGSVISIKVYKKFLYVSIEGGESDFGHSVGLMGDFKKGEMLARDGVSLLKHDANQMGAEWQVQATEPMLFQEVRSPQLPLETCKMPAAGRRLRMNADPKLLEAAKAACSHMKNPNEIANCVYDVVATGDLGMATAGDIEGEEFDF